MLLGQQLRIIALQTESQHLKLVAELYDKAAESLVQVRHRAMTNPNVFLPDWDLVSFWPYLCLALCPACCEAD